MKETGGQMMHYAGWLLLFVFTATCTVLLLGEYAPPQAPWLPFAGLAVFEFGVLHWLHWHKHNALNAVQAWIALTMAVISALAIAGCTGLELLKWFQAAGDLVLQPWWKDIVLYSIIGCITLNILSFIGVALADPKHVAKLHAYKDHPQYVEVRVNATARETYDGQRLLAATGATAQLPETAASLTGEQLERIREFFSRAEDHWDDGERDALANHVKGGRQAEKPARPFTGIKGALKWLWAGNESQAVQPQATNQSQTQVEEDQEEDQSDDDAQSAGPTSAATPTPSK